MGEIERGSIREFLLLAAIRHAEQLEIAKFELEISVAMLDRENQDSITQTQEAFTRYQELVRPVQRDKKLEKKAVDIFEKFKGKTFTVRK